MVVFSHLVQVQATPWLRLYFGDVQLSGSPSAGNGSFLRITSQTDGGVQVLDSLALADWGNTSGYFNGEAVLIELLARAGTGANRVVVEKVVAGIQSELDDPLTSCGPTDDRVPSSDPRSARIMPKGCTGFLFNQRPNCLLTAGHCYGADNLQVVQFNVPESYPDGTIRNPPLEDQYPVDRRSVQFQYLHDPDHYPGNDWCVFGTINNDITGRSPLQAQGASYRLATSVPTADGSTLRMTGYGIDSSPLRYNRTQQTDAGPYEEKEVSQFKTIVKYFIDTDGGNSGSAVEHIASGLVYAIHTHGCLANGEIARGTPIDHPGLQSALACPVVFNVCTDCNGNGILDQCDLNCASPCGGCNVPRCSTQVVVRFAHLGRRAASIGRSHTYVVGRSRWFAGQVGLCAFDSRSRPIAPPVGQSHPTKVVRPEGRTVGQPSRPLSIPPVQTRLHS